MEFPHRADDGARFTIKDVADASGLPQPVIAQLVDRTWTARGWMYTEGQLQEAVELRARLIAQRQRRLVAAEPIAEHGQRDA